MCELGLHFFLRMLTISELAAIEMTTVYCDECGNTGPALLDSEQPVFVLVSNNFTDEESLALLGCVRSPQRTEPKFTRLRGSGRGIASLSSFLTQPVLTSERIVASVAHKEYMAVCKIVDVLIEPIAHRDGIDYYERGLNIATANVMFYATRALCGDTLFRSMLTAFVVMVRIPSRATIDAFYTAAWDIYNGSSESVRGEMAPILASQPYIHEILRENGPRSIDPAVTNFVLHCQEWGRRLQGNFDVVHDHSKPMYAERELLHGLVGTDVEARTLIGYDRRRFEFPLRAQSLTFADSRVTPQLQVSDLVAGAIAAEGIGKIKETETDLTEMLKTVNLERFLIGAQWPSLEVTPQQLGTEEVGGINATDFMAAHLEKAGLVNDDQRSS